jgi:hypothetical protein
MRVRALSSSGDRTWGKGLANFYIDNAQAVGQKVTTRLDLLLGSWYLDTSKGVDWFNKILGTNTSATRDLLIKETILNTTGVTAITSYTSTVDTVTREFTVKADIDTLYGSTSITTTKSVLQ